MPETIAHPYIPNSAPGVKKEMLREIGVESTDELYGAIPERLRLGRRLDIPTALASEAELRRFMEAMLSKNESCARTLSFLGGGCWQHEVPAVCDEIANRGEFVTAYYGETYTDHGKNQALFEYASMLGELLELEAVSMPTYDWASAASSAICMAARITGRGRALVSASTSPERLSVIDGYCRPWAEVERISFDPDSGLLDLDALRSALSSDTACVYVESPGFLGSIETQIAEIAELAHGAGALLVTGVDPISLGVLEAPPRYGADIVCGDLQPLGIHMHFGGGLAGFVATPDTEEYVSQYPTFLIGLEPTSEGEYGFGEVTWERTSYVRRDESREYAGTTQFLWAIAAGAYLALMGPTGMAEVGQGIMQRSQYAAARLGELPGVRSPRLSAPFFKEFVVDLNETGKTVAQVNAGLRASGIYGGRDLSRDFPQLGQSALLCVTEAHTQADIDRLAEALGEAVS